MSEGQEPGEIAGGSNVDVSDGTGREADPCADVTDRRVRDLQQENERLSDLLDVLDHDLRNLLAVAVGRLDLARAELESDHLEAVARSHERMEELLDDLLAAREEGFAVGDTEPVSLAACARQAWDPIDDDAATLVVESNREMSADPDRLTQLLENLFHNAVEHGVRASDSPARREATVQGLEGREAGLTVTVGGLSTDSGFFVEDDGCGLPSTDTGRLFEAGVSTSDGPGLGLSIVRDVVSGHGWAVEATTSESGGARFEISNVDRPTTQRSRPVTSR